MASMKVLAVFLLVLLPPVTSQSGNLNGTRGGTILWPCTVDTPFEPSDSRIYWQTEHPDHVIHVFNKGKEEFDHQNDTFARRTKIFLDQLPAGNISLLLDSLSLEDDRRSLVVVFQPKSGAQKICHQTLYVAAPFQQPEVVISEKTATCSTQGGYPKPVITWNSGHLSLSPSEEQYSVSKDGTYSVKSTVNVTGFDSLTCMVYNPTSNETCSASKNTAEPRPENTWVIVGVMVGVAITIAIVAIVVALMKWRRQRSIRRAEHEMVPIEEI